MEKEKKRNKNPEKLLNAEMFKKINLLTITFLSTTIHFVLDVKWSTIQFLNSKGKEEGRVCLTKACSIFFKNFNRLLKK